ncbi:MAG TPA: transporter substrate-binding domain-containing protein [Ilumatobacteraceae bacterium]|nr:transporter substrate-binding domain-containing protein [Ilumatobacteraceae bacterium]
MKKTLITVALAGLLVAACSDDKKDSADTPDTTAAASTTAAPGTTSGEATTAAACAEGKTLEAGSLTLATGDPAFPPYMIDDDPTSGEGFESALALAVAKEMGFEGDQVKWIRTSFDTAVAGSDSGFDFNLQQFSINDERKQVVSFSDPYYTANQAVLGYADGPAKDVTKLSDLKSLKLGAAAGTTSLTFVEEVIQPDTEVFAFNSNADAKAALDAGQIDAIVTDLPTGLYISAVEIEGTKVFGQFPVDAGGAGDQWGLLFTKDNPLVECANLALQALTESGELAAITDEWMAGYTEAPTLSKD